MVEYLKICKIECDKEMTREDVLEDVECGFCDVPYILLERGY